MPKRKKSRKPALINAIKLPERQGAFDPIRAAVLMSKPLTRIKEFAKVHDAPEVGRIYDALAGCGIVSVLLGSNFVEQQRLEDQVKRPLRKLIVQEGMEFALQVEPFHLAEATTGQVEAALARSRARVYAKTGISSITAVVPLPFPDERDPLRFGVSVVIATLFWGAAIKDTLERARARSRLLLSSPTLPSATFEWLPAGKKAPLADALKFMFRPPVFSWAQAAFAAADIGVEDWNKSSFIRKRALVMFQVLSMLPVERMYFGHGEGEVILKPAINAARLRLKTSSGGKPPIHRDGVSDFWWRELRRLGFSELTVPFVKLR